MNLSGKIGKDCNILVTGGSGLVGTHLKKYLPTATYISSKDFDLTSEESVKRLFLEKKWDIVIHLAAKVGGIFDNISNQGLYFEENVLMNTLVLKYARLAKVEKVIAILSTCIYPDVNNRYPIELEDLHLGPPTETNFSYGYAKRSLAVQIDAYNKQWNTNWMYIVPCNLYGEGDKDDDKKSHFVTALIKKIYDAKKENKKSIILFGDGTPIRQFIHAEDLAKIIALTVDRGITKSFNVASDETYTIKEIAEIAINACGGSLEIEFDIEKPNGQLRKDVTTKELKEILPDFEFIKLKDGIKKAYDCYEENRISIGHNQ
jgi:GDP-L-fucose synthase